MSNAIHDKKIKIICDKFNLIALIHDYETTKQKEYIKKFNDLIENKNTASDEDSSKSKIIDQISRVSNIKIIDEDVQSDNVNDQEDLRTEYKVIKKMYKELAKTFHPDKGGNKREFAKLSEAISDGNNQYIIREFFDNKSLSDINPNKDDFNELSGIEQDMTTDINKIKLSIAYNIYDDEISSETRFKAIKTLSQLINVPLKDIIKLLKSQLKGNDTNE